MRVSNNFTTKKESVFVDAVHKSTVAYALYKCKINPRVSLVAAVYRKNEEGEVELRIFNNSVKPVEIQLKFMGVLIVYIKNFCKCINQRKMG